MSVELIDIISSMVENLFFNNVLTEKQLNDSVDVDIIIESLMMIDSNKDRELFLRQIFLPLQQGLVQKISFLITF